VLTLCILNYNGADSLRESIQSVLDQTQKPDRIVVIDNASIDNSRQIAVKMGVEVVDADNRNKFITGLNVAIKIANGGWLFFMQNDVVLDKNCIKHMLEDMPTHIFIAQPVIYQKNGKIDNAGMDYRWPGFGVRRNKKWWEGARYEQCGLVTTICFLMICPYDQYDIRFSPAYYEDIDFYLSSLREHYLIPSASATHLGNHTFSQTYKKAEISKICLVNRNKLIRKHYRGADRWLRLAVSTSGYMVKKAFDVITERWVTANNRKKVSV